MKHTVKFRYMVAGSEGCRILPDTGDKREDSKIIAMVNGRDLITDTANAAELVRRWNLHEQLVEALKEISKGEGRYSMDKYQFACNCINDMKALAVAALKLAREGM